MISRRLLLASAGATVLAGCMRQPPDPITRAADAPPPPMPARYGAILDEPHPVPAVPPGVVPPHLWMQEVDNPYPQEAPGTIVVDPGAAYLHLVQPAGRALRYGVGVGADGFAWSGDAVVQYRRHWPRWKAPDSMIERRPEYEPYSVANGGMDPGPGNPLGARALYLFQGRRDTLYRIHGACEPKYLGQAVSSGCIRMLDQDVIDLHNRVRDGATVVVRPAAQPAVLAELY